MAQMDAARAREVLTGLSGLSAAERQAVETLLAESKGVGTCRIGDEPEPLFLELLRDPPKSGQPRLRYCCGHAERHCSGFLDGKQS